MRTKALQPLILVVCEGATEEQVLKALRKHLRLPALQVFVVGQGGDPRNVVQLAKKKEARIRGKSRSAKHKPEV
jgi:hypothetical protein